MYEILIEKSAERELLKLPSIVFNRITEKILALAQNPMPAGSRKLAGRGPNDWRIRVGDYRVVYAINEAEQQIEIMKVGHRREVYR